MAEIYYEDLIPIAYLEKKDILFTMKEFISNDLNTPTFCMRVFCDGSMKYCFGLMERFSKYAPFDEIEVGEEPISSFLHDRIGKTFNGHAIFNMMQHYSEESFKFQNIEDKWKYSFSEVYAAKQDGPEEKYL